MGKIRLSDSSSSGSNGGSGNTLRGLFASIADHFSKGLRIAGDRHVKQKLENINNKKEEKMDRTELSDSHARLSNPYMRRRTDPKTSERPRHSSNHRRRHISHLKNCSKHKDHTTLTITLPFSNEVIYTGAVGVIAGSTTAIRLRSSDTKWLGEKGFRAGCSAVTAAIASLIIGQEGPRDVIRDVGLPVVLSLGVDHILWE